jgi:hypothetical protein
MDLNPTSGVYPAGAHICYLYRDDEERRRVVPAFVKSGLSADELVAYFADVADEDRLTEALLASGVLPVDEAQRHGLIASGLSTFRTGNRFVPAKMLGRLHDTYVRACTDGFSGARVIGQMTWALRGIPGSEHLVEFESQINGLIATNPMTVLCAYDMTRFDGATGFDVLGVHPMLLVRGQVIPNPYLQSRG